MLRRLCRRRHLAYKRCKICGRRVPYSCPYCEDCGWQPSSWGLKMGPVVLSFFLCAIAMGWISHPKFLHLRSPIVATYPRFPAASPARSTTMVAHRPTNPDISAAPQPHQRRTDSRLPGISSLTSLMVTQSIIIYKPHG